MKKLVSFISLFFVFLLSVNFDTFAGIIEQKNIENNINTIETLDSYDSYAAQTKATTIDYVYTPNGTRVQVFCRDEMSSSTIQACNQRGDALVPEATRISSSTTKYNCHSYAWYRASTSNPYWMNDPSSYYTDGSYEESVGNVGDIICYYDNSGFNLHSGIVIAKTSGKSNGICGNSDLVTVRSKWGAWGLYEHRGDQCPYTSTYGGEANYVKYYRKHNHNFVNHYCSCGKYTTSHDYHAPYNWIDYSNHTDTCGCGDLKVQGHAVLSESFMPGQKYATCLLCGGSAEIGFIQLDSSGKVSVNGSYLLPNGVAVLLEKDLNSFINGSLIFFDFEKKDSYVS